MALRKIRIVERERETEKKKTGTRDSLHEACIASVFELAASGGGTFTFSEYDWTRARGVWLLQYFTEL